MHEVLNRLDSRTIAIWSVVALLVGLAYALYPDPGAGLETGGPSEIVYWMPMEPALFDAMKPLVEAFEQRNPQYRVRLGTATARDASDPTRLLLGVAGGMPPDVVYFNRPFIIEWASRGAFTDLAPFIARDLEAGRGDAVRPDHYYPVTWEEPIYKGGNYAIANGTDVRALYYCTEPLVRAGLTHGADAPAGARPGDARPPATWEEICHKRLHALGRVESDGSVTLLDFVRRPAVNEGVPEGVAPDLAAARVRPGDVVVLVAGTNVFRGRIAGLTDAAHFSIDLSREQPTGLDAIPAAFRGEREVKVFDQDDYMSRLNRFDPETGRLTAAAFIPLFGNSWLYLYGWQNGARFMSEDGTECLLDSPEVAQALQWLTDAYDAMGGQEAANVFQAMELSTGLDPFLTGAVAMRIDVNDFLTVIAAFKPDHDFSVTAAPLPARSAASGMEPFGWGAGWCYAIPATARNPEGAWALLRWFTSLEANQMLYESQAALSLAKGQPYLPRMHPDKRVMQWLEETYIRNSANLNQNAVDAFHQFMTLLPRNRHLPVTPVGQKLWNEHVRASNAATNHLMTPHDALSYGKRRVQNTLDRILDPPTGPRVHWPLLIGLYVLAVLAFFTVLVWTQERRRRRHGAARSRWFEGYIAASPWMVGFIVFGAGPVLFSLVISFCHYDVLNPARFIGLDNFVNLLGSHQDPITGERAWNDPVFWRSLGNTAFMVLGVPLGIVAGLAIALLLNTNVRGLHLYRTIFYLPAIVPAVATFILWLWILEPSRGLLNQGLMALGLPRPPGWLQDPAWAKPSLILMGLWGAGAGMVIWLAGLKDIPVSLYEAASIDGANRVQRFLHITLPLLTPYIFYNLVMGMIGVFQIFEAAFVMTDGGPADSTLFYAYKLFNEAFRYLNMGVACAMAWVLFLIVFAMTLVQLWLGKHWVHYGG